MPIACPTQLVGVIEGVYYFNATICGSPPTQTLANDTRDHTIGINCSNVLDPILVPGPVPDPGPGTTDSYDCGCVHTGLERYTSMNSAVLLAPGFDIDAHYVVRYEDKNEDGHYVERLARLFVIKGNGVWKKKRIRIGQEMAPGTKVSGKKVPTLEGELARPFGHHHRVTTDEGLFNIVTKNYLQPLPPPEDKPPRSKRHR
jgi:hypothetical protein